MLLCRVDADKVDVVFDNDAAAILVLAVNRLLSVMTKILFILIERDHSFSKQTLSLLTDSELYCIVYLLSPDGHMYRLIFYNNECIKWGD